MNIQSCLWQYRTLVIVEFAVKGMVLTEAVTIWSDLKPLKTIAVGWPGGVPAGTIPTKIGRQSTLVYVWNGN